MKYFIHYFKYVSGLCLLLLLSCQQQPTGNIEQDNLVIYPPPPAKTRIQYLTSISKSSDFTRKQSSLNRFLMGEEEDISLIKPYGVNVNGSKIYICDTGIGGLVIMDTETGLFERFIPGGRGQLQLPVNSDMDEEGNIYIADGNRQQVVIFDATLKYRGEITLYNDAKPTDVEVVDNKIYVAAANDHSIHVYNTEDYRLLNSFPKGTDSSDPAHLYQPINLEAMNDKIYVTDVGNCSVKIFDASGTYLNSFGSPGNGLGQFTRPKGISCDTTGNIYVVDAAFENAQLFNQDGKLLMYFGGTYLGPGGMYLPADITISYCNLDHFSNYVDPAFRLEYLIYVTNQYGPDKISVYGFVGLTE